MAGAALPGRLNWRLARLTRRVDETARARTLVLEVPDWPGHEAGQHVDVRLTAPDGYQAQRSYSIASPPEDHDQVSITVERIEEGEVSPYLTDALMEGDSLELRGPIGGYFVWSTEMGGPLFLVAGGSGICPLMAMIRHRAALGSRVPTRLLYSSRSQEDILYRNELDQLAGRGDGLEVSYTLTRSQPPGWRGYSRRIDRPMLAEAGFTPAQRPLCMVCGPTPLVEAVATALVELGNPADRVKTERFGPTGG
ncbi:MAG TPA: ferredoxin reductase [Myxococcaceae bacterium]|nr:ferredoxin reductase [Myxococcaceae bacterium]